MPLSLPAGCVHPPASAHFRQRRCCKESAHWHTAYTRAAQQLVGTIDSFCMLQAQALRGLYTLWYAAGNTLGLLPTLPTQQKDILPAFAVDLPISPELSIKDGRLGYTNRTLTWQV